LTGTEKLAATPELYELGRARSPLFTGRLVAALAADPDVMNKTGRALDAGDLADEYHLGEPGL